MILTRLKHHVAAGLAERVALCGDAGEMTYAQLVQQVEHLATWLQAHMSGLWHCTGRTHPRGWS